jgi:hypothetical protein
MQIVKIDQDRFVFHAGDLCQAFLMLLEGNVRVQLTSASGREVTLYRIRGCDSECGIPGRPRSIPSIPELCFRRFFNAAQECHCTYRGAGVYLN